ncbi:3284_t:CDS:2, partial [Racocetra fulgida]
WASVVSIGINSTQGVTTIFDLETRDSFVESTNCILCPGYTFDPTNSSTYNKTQTTSYNSGRFHINEYGVDIISTGNVTIPYVFGLVDSINDTESVDLYATGVFGLASLASQLFIK